MDGADPTPTKEPSFRPEANHIEPIDEPDLKPRPSIQPFPFADAATPNAQLPFIPASKVAAESSSTNNNNNNNAKEGKPQGTTPPTARRLLIVIDAIVYDCTDFARSQHPGGSAVIESLAGSDCSWQFWRFHSAQHLRDVGRGLRVGRTAGVRNRFGEERAKYVGLGGLDSGQDW
ncbi:hypothetical protein SLS54_010009 [Diplodia seriata]